MKKLIIILIALCLLSPCFAAERTFYTLNNEAISSEKLISYPNTILFVWATWCPSCRRELEKLSRECMSCKGINVWYVDTGEKASIVMRYANVKELSDSIRDRIILDKEGYIVQRFSVIAIPTYIFFKDGELVFKSYFCNDEIIEKVFGKE